MIEWFGTEEMKKEMRDDITTKRGAPPSIVEWIILAWVSGTGACDMLLALVHVKSVMFKNHV